MCGQGTGGSRWTALAAVVAFAVLGWPGGATAGSAGPTVSLGKAKGLHYFKAKFEQVVSQVAQPAQCGDANPTGGGGAISGPTADAFLHESYPLPGNGWQAEGSTTGAARTLTAFAVCGGADLDYTANQSAFPENTTLHATGTCGPSLEPIGGGASATGPGIQFIASRPQRPPSTPGWASSASNTTMDDTLLDAHAVCSDDYTVKYRQSDPVRLAAGDSAKAIAKCKPDEAVMGGGFMGVKGEVIGYRTPVLATKPWDSKDDAKKVPDDGWLAKAGNLQDFRVNLVAHAVCKRPSA